MDKLVRARVYIEGVTSWRPESAECWFCKLKMVPAAADSTPSSAEKGGGPTRGANTPWKGARHPEQGSSLVLVDGLMTQFDPPTGEA